MIVIELFSVTLTKLLEIFLSNVVLHLITLLKGLLVLEWRKIIIMSKVFSLPINLV